jgi:hypothetical protein
MQSFLREIDPLIQFSESLKIPKITVIADPRA